MNDGEASSSPVFACDDGSCDRKGGAVMYEGDDEGREGNRLLGGATSMPTDCAFISAFEPTEYPTEAGLAFMESLEGLVPAVLGRDRRADAPAAAGRQPRA